MVRPQQPAVHRSSAPATCPLQHRPLFTAAGRRHAAALSSDFRAKAPSVVHALPIPGRTAGGRPLSLAQTAASSPSRPHPHPCHNQQKQRLQPGLRHRPAAGLQTRCQCASDVALSGDSEVDERTEEYNRSMQQRMGWEASPFTYHYERGLYYHEIWRGGGSDGGDGGSGGSLLCGSMPRNVQDLDALHHVEHVDVVLNLQENKDFDYWNVDFHSIYWRAVSHDMTIERVPAVDFDPDSLRKILPAAVQVVAKAMAANQRVYVHCTAGLGRAPAVCIAYLYWWCGLDLDEAYQHLTDIRLCGPKKEAVRGATFDLLDSRQPEDFRHLPPEAYASLSASDRQKLQATVLALQRS